MITKKPFATISYNSQKYLTFVLDTMIEERLIEFYLFINHYPEEDEKKQHIHLFVIPAGKIDTEIFRERLIELTPNNDLPLRSLPCVSSKFADWYLYALHDKDYLMTKLESRKYHYNKEAFVYSDEEYFTQYLHTTDFSKYKRLARFKEMVLSGVPFDLLVANGFIPPQLVYQYSRTYDSILNSKNLDIDTILTGEITDRGDRDGHD